MFSRCPEVSRYHLCFILFLSVEICDEKGILQWRHRFPQSNGGYSQMMCELPLCDWTVFVARKTTTYGQCLPHVNEGI